VTEGGDVATPAETAAMTRALELAAGVLGTTNPNPAVGAVVLDRRGQIVASGATRPAGAAHAEVVALAAAGEEANGGTLVVTLEPCRHVGRTGPCTDAILAAGISRVVYAVADPHSAAAGGAEALRAAGLEVEPGLLNDAATSDLLPWLTAVRRRRPHVTWKYAATLDGRTAAADGTSRWITGEDSRRDVHRLRALSDAVVVGIGTVLADDTHLTVRDWPTTRQPLRVVVDGKGRTPVSAQILDSAACTLLAVGDDAEPERLKALRDTGAEVIELFEREQLIVLVEGGATLAASFVRQRLIDRVVGFHAPALLGAGPPVLGDAGIPTISAAARLTLTDVTRLGADVRITADVDRGSR
jgi:diaminohydroxyphosphoribosylaminopyrimidine deaminase / 5-amino-6-(5-phosphoribosylamino)uracil reductase